MAKVQPIITPVIFVVFIVLVVFSLINMFIAIIVDAFDEAKEAIDNEQSFLVAEDSFFYSIFNALQVIIDCVRLSIFTLNSLTT